LSAIITIIANLEREDVEITVKMRRYGSVSGFSNTTSFTLEVEPALTDRKHGHSMRRVMTLGVPWRSRV
jgi:hypothetical protein